MGKNLFTKVFLAFVLISTVLAHSVLSLGSAEELFETDLEQSINNSDFEFDYNDCEDNLYIDFSENEVNQSSTIETPAPSAVFENVDDIPTDCAESTVAVTDDAILSSDSSDYYKIESLLNDHITIVVEGDNSDIALNTIGIEADSADGVIGYAVTAEDKEVDAIPIVALAIDENDCALTGDSLATALNETDIINDLDLNEISDEVEHANSLKSIAKASSYSKAYASSSKFVYLYKKGNVSGTGTTYDYDTANSKNGWSKIGSISLNLNVVNIKTLGTTTFDKVYCDCYASGLNGLYVTEFKPSISVTANSSNSIPSFTIPESSGSTSKTSSLNTGISTKGELNASSTESISYNPNGMKITSIGGEKYIKRWVCVPYTHQANKTYELAPAAIVKKTNGTTATNKVSFYINHFYLSSSLRTYKINVIDDAVCSVSIKNHKKV